jgi:Uma2 family endonuclease
MFASFGDQPMSIAEIPRKMTAEELLAMPDDGVERWLIRGELRENAESDMNRRNPDHSGTMTRVASRLDRWLDAQPQPRGKVYTGDAAFKLRPDSPTLVGIDVAYVSANLRAQTPKGRKIIEGVPILAVEILSPSDVHSDVTEKVQEYLDTGVALVWVIDPDFETVSAFTKNAEPILFNRAQELTAEPHLPGFRVRVADLFE